MVDQGCGQQRDTYIYHMVYEMRKYKGTLCSISEQTLLAAVVFCTCLEIVLPAYT